MKKSELRQIIREEIFNESYGDFGRAKLKQKEKIAIEISDLSKGWSGFPVDVKNFLNSRDENKLINTLEQIKELVKQYKSL